MKTHLMVFTLLLIATNTFAQKEQYFSNTPNDSIKISKLDCIHFGVSTLPKNNMVPSIYFGYLRELRLSNTSGLIITADIKNIFTSRIDYSINGGSSTQGKSSFVDAIHATFSIEPRWYYGYKNRFWNGKKTILNSGSFVSIPISYESGILNNIYPDFSSFGYSFQIPDAILVGNYIAASPQIGYRYALSQKVLVEIGIKYAILLYSSNKHMMESGNALYMNLKVGYCF